MFSSWEDILWRREKQGNHVCIVRYLSKQGMIIKIHLKLNFGVLNPIVFKIAILKHNKINLVYPITIVDLDK